MTNQKAPRVGCADPSWQVELRVTSSDDGDGGGDLSIRPLTYKGGGGKVGGYDGGHYDTQTETKADRETAKER